MNLGKWFSVAVLAIALAVGTLGCGLDAAAKAALSKKAAPEAVGEVAPRVLKKVMLQIGGGSYAPAYVLAATEDATAPTDSTDTTDIAFDYNEEFLVDESFTEAGVSYTAKGKVTISVTETSFDVTMDIQTTWKGMKIALEDTTYDCSGNLSMVGGMAMVGADTETPTTTGEFDSTGSIVLDEDAYDVVMNVTFNDTEMKMKGTIGGEPFEDTQSMDPASETTTSGDSTQPNPGDSGDALVDEETTAL